MPLSTYWTVHKEHKKENDNKDGNRTDYQLETMSLWKNYIFYMCNIQPNPTTQPSQHPYLSLSLFSLSV
jgi:hypothetical protein